MEQVLDEADAATGSTPDDLQAAPDTTADDASSATAAESGQPGAGRAPAAAEQVDRDAQAFERLQSGEDPKAIRQNPKPIAPSADQAETQAGEAESKTVQPKAPVVAPQGEAADAAEVYEGLDAKAINTLRRANLIIPAEEWNEMGPRQRATIFNAAKKILQNNGRISQQIGQLRQTQNTAPADQGTVDAGQENYDATDTQGVDAGETGEVQEPGTAQEPPRVQQRQPARQQQGVRAQTQPPRAREAEAQPVELDEAFKGFAEYLGEDAAKPVKAFIANQQQALAQREQENLALSQQLQGMAEQHEGMARQFFLPQEQAGFEKLESKAGEIPDETRDIIRASAVGHFEAMSRAGKPITWQQAIERAGYGVLEPDIEQQAQQQLLDRRAKSLRATPTKGVPTRPNRAIAPVDRDAAIYAELENGKDARAARASVIG